MNSPLDDRHGQDIGALLGGGLEPETVSALEMSLRADSAAWAEYVSLKALAEAYESVGVQLREAAPAVDLADDICLAADLESLAESQAAGVPPVALLEEVLLRADLIALGEAHARTVPEVDLVADVLLQANLDALGEIRAQETPEIDLVTSVMAEVRRENATRNVVRPRPRETHRTDRRKPFTIPWAALAAAACLAAGAWLVVNALLKLDQTANDLPGAANVAQKNLRSESAAPPDVTADSNTISPVRPAPIGEELATLAWPDQERPEPDEQPPNPYATLTLQQILEARRNAIEGSGADRALLAHLASLSPQEARALLERSGLSTEAALGAALFLPQDEAIDVLLSKLSELPDDPYLRYALAKNLAGKEGGSALEREQLAAWRKSDPNNGMPYFMEAQVALREQDVQTALLALEQAEALGQSYGYAQATARYRQQALIAAGMGENEARLLAASTAASQEYLHIRQMANELLQQGQYFESIGDFDTAQRIYEAVQSFGEGVAFSAAFVNEELAGLETQHDALGNLRNLYEMIGSPQTVQLLQDSLNLIAMAFNDLRDYIDAYNAILAAGNINLINDLAGLVLNQGDRNVVAQ